MPNRPGPKELHLSARLGAAVNAHAELHRKRPNSPRLLTLEREIRALGKQVKRARKAKR